MSEKNPKIAFYDLETSGLSGKEDYIISCSIITKNDDGSPFTTFLMMDPDDRDEKKLVQSIWDELKRYDFVVGYNNAIFDDVFLYYRLKHHNIKHNKVFKFNQRDQYFNKNEKVIFNEFQSIDFYEMIPSIFSNMEFPTLRLDDVAHTLISKQKVSLDSRLPIEIYEAGEYELLERYNNMDVELLYEINENKDITGICFSGMEYTNSKAHQLQNKSKLWNNYFLSLGLKEPNEAHKRPDIVKNLGGYNKEPVIGLHKANGGRILSFDFASLYPSIFVEFKDCYGFDSDMGDTIAGIMEKRFEAKRAGEDALQYFLKILINSFYGLCEYSRSAFYRPFIAAMITFVGRLAIKLSVKYVESIKGSTVLFTSTDSIYVKSANINIEDFLDKIHHHIDNLVKFIKDENIFEFLSKQHDDFDISIFEDKIINNWDFNKVRDVPGSRLRFEFESDIKNILLMPAIKNYAYELKDSGDIKFVGSNFTKSNAAPAVNNIMRQYILDIFDGTIDITKPFNLHIYVSRYLKNISLEDLAIPFKIGKKNYSDVIKSNSNSFSAWAVYNSIHFLNKEFLLGNKVYLLQTQGNFYNITDVDKYERSLGFFAYHYNELSDGSLNRDNYKFDRIKLLCKNNIQKLIDGLKFHNTQRTLFDNY